MRIKGFLIVVGGILILLIIAFLVFVFTFDANRYKGVLITKLEQTINKNVKIDDISLNPWQGLAVKIRGISIKDTDKTWQEALLKIANLDVSVKILPLIKKDIQIQNISLDGLMLDFSRDSFKMPASKSPGSDKDAGGVAALGALKFLAENICIRDSSIRYKDIIQEKPIDLGIDVMSVILKNISLYGPVNIEARLSVFGRGKENIQLKAILYPEIDTKSPFLKNLELKIDMDNLDIQGAINALGLQAIPQIQGKELKGRLVISSSKIELDPKKIYDSKVFIDLLDVRTDFIPIKMPLQNINIKAEFNNGNLDIQKFTGVIGSGGFNISGTIKDIFGNQDSNLKIKLNNIETGELLPDMPTNSPSFKGVLNLGMQGSSTGLSQDTILKTLKAKGNMKLENGSLENMNVLRVALDKLNMLPGLVQRLKDNLPERYSELLKEKHTAFKPMNADFEIKTGRLFFEKLIIESDAFYLVCLGSLGMDGDLDIGSNLFIPQDLSDAFTNVVPELGFLKDNNGIITMPLDIKGKSPNISVMPNLDYVIQKLAVSKGQEILDRIFRGKDAQPEQQGQESPESETQEEGKGSSGQKPVETIIKGVLDIFSGNGEKN